MGNRDRGRGNKAAQRRRQKARRLAVARFALWSYDESPQLPVVASQRRAKRSAFAVLGLMGAGLVVAVLAAMGVL